MPSTIITKNGSGAPLAADLVAGELAVDLTNGRLYTDDGSSVIEIGLNPSGNVDVTGTVTADGLTVGDSSSSFTLATIQSSTSGESELRMGDTDTDAGSISYTNSDDTMTFRAAAAARMSLNSTGLDVTGTVTADSAGIGTNSPAYQLDVIGTTEKLYARIGDSSNNSFTTTTSVLGLYGDSANNNAGPGLSFFAGVTTAEIYGTRQGAGSDGDLRFHTRISGTVAERMRIDSSGNVGIGTSSPSTALTVTGAGDVATFDTTSAGGTVLSRQNNVGNTSVHYILAFKNSDSTVANIATINRTGATTNIGTGYELKIEAAGTGYITHHTNGSERLRIDSAGNLLVGTTETPATLITTSTTSHAGTGISDLGYLSVARDLTSFPGSGGVAFFNRLATDGPIADFRKDGATVGSISTVASNIAIGKDDTALYISATTDSLTPTTIASGVPVERDGGIDIGRSSARFKDLYLSGGAYLGGTAAGNKLDYYEEGTWTPTFTNLGTVTLLVARYTRIGNACTIYLSFTCTSTPTLNSSLFTLPFTSAGITSGTFTRSTFEGGFIEAQSSNTNCYFASTASTNVGSFYCNITFETT